MDEPNETAAAEGAPRPWRAILTLGTTAGFSLWLVMGDPVAAGGLAAATVALTGLFPVRPRRPGTLYTYAVAVPVSAFLIAASGGKSGPDVWHDLQREFATRAPMPAGAQREARVELHRMSHGGLVYQPFRFRRAWTSFDGAGVFLRLSWPQTLVYDALRIPHQSLTRCDVRAGRTEISIQYPTVKLIVEDELGRAAAWCAENGLLDVS